MMRTRRCAGHEVARAATSALLPALALLGCCVVSPVHGADLTVDRLFDAPALAGPTLTGLGIAPDNSRVLFLRGKTADKDRLDLWQFDVANGHASLLVDSDAFRAGGGRPPDEELARRERQRTAALSGILDYAFAAPAGALVMPVDGRLFYVRAGGARRSDGRAADRGRRRLHGCHGLRRAATRSPTSATRTCTSRRSTGPTRRHALTHDGGGAVRQWRRGIRCPGGDGPPYRLLVVAGRHAHCIRARRRIRGTARAALRGPGRRAVDARAALSGRRRSQRGGYARRRRRRLRRHHVGRPRRRSRRLPGTGALAAGWRDPGGPAPEPRPAPARAAVRRHRDRRQPHDPDRDQHELDRPERRTDVPARVPGIICGCRAATATRTCTCTATTASCCAS